MPLLTYGTRLSTPLGSYILPFLTNCAMLNLSGRLRGIFLRLAVLSSFCSDVSKSVENLTEKGQDYFDGLTEKQQLLYNRFCGRDLSRFWSVNELIP